MKFRSALNTGSCLAYASINRVQRDLTPHNELMSDKKTELYLFVSLHSNLTEEKPPAPEHLRSFDNLENVKPWV